VVAVAARQPSVEAPLLVVKGMLYATPPMLTLLHVTGPTLHWVISKEMTAPADDSSTWIVMLWC
jgi:hypothetical protein